MTDDSSATSTTLSEGADEVSEAEGRESVFGFARMRSPFVGGYGFFFFGIAGPCNDHGTNTSCESTPSSKLSFSTPRSSSVDVDSASSPLRRDELVSAGVVRLEMGTVPRFARRAEPFPLKAGSCSSAQTQIRTVPTCEEELVDVEGVEVEGEGGRRGTTARINCWMSKLSARASRLRE